MSYLCQADVAREVLIHLYSLIYYRHMLETLEVFYRLAYHLYSLDQAGFFKI